MSAIGDRIREIREKLKMTQEQLANNAQISKGFLSDVENNKRNISSRLLLRISNQLGASVDYLLRGEVKGHSEEEKIVIPSELSKAAENLNLSYSKTIELLSAHKSIVARRSNKSIKDFSAKDWEELYKAIKKVFG